MSLAIRGSEGMGPAMAMFAFTIWQSFCTTGIVYGWQPLMLILKQEGVYSHRCGEGIEDCNSRDIALNMVFVSGAMANILGGVVGGPIPSPKVGLALGNALLLVGSLILGFAPPSSDALWPFAYFCQGLGGGIVHFAMMNVGNLFGRKKGYVMSCLAGILGISAMLYQIFYGLYFAGMSRQSLFVLHSIILLANFLVSMWLWPVRPFRTGDRVIFEKCRMVKISSEASNGGVGGHANAGFKAILKAAATAKFVTFLIFLASQLWFNRCLMGMYAALLQWKNRVFEDHGMAPLNFEHHLSLFNMSQGLIGSTAIPMFGFVTSRLGHRAAPALITGILSIIWLACILSVAEWPLYVLYIIAGWHRQFFFSAFLNYMTCEYPPEVYGRLLVITNMINGIVVLLQNPQLDFILNSLDGDFTPMLVVMMILASTLTALAAVAFFFERQGAAQAREAAEKDWNQAKENDNDNESCESEETKDTDSDSIDGKKEVSDRSIVPPV
mmetsp:Transcript_76810/g.167881  ORF Transcript_76810/g.167881 Transcript_76810/m.167881 type:complete len:497 (+) Transcript_76810:106-1596(+)